MKRVTSILLILIIGLLSAYSQTVIIGTVRDKQKEAVPFVTVTMQAKGESTIAGFASTDEAGCYRLTFDGNTDSLTITVRGMMVETMMRTVPNRSTTIDFIVDEKANQLKEVKVTATPVRRSNDTLTYVVGSFAGQSDRTIEDVLKKMPGIDVSSSGAITYNGKAINKFYIEDLDMLGGRYNLATRNIEAKDVASVQVYENHQPIKAESVFSDQAAVNLRLKDSAKGIWAVQALAGLGYNPVLYNAELTAMQFARNRQHISTYKGNNSGHTADEELLKHYDSGAALPQTGSMLSVCLPGTPDVEKKRYTDNLTNSVSANQLVKIKDSELTVNINFYNERLDREGYMSFTQYLPDAATPLVIEETTSNTAKENNLDVTLGVQTNKDLEYLRNSLNVKSSWSDTYTHLAAKEGKYQHLDNPYFSVSNDLSMMKRWGKHLFRVSFDVAYNNRPHELRVSPAYYFGNDSLQMLSQEVTQKNITASLRTSYGLTVGNFTLNYTPRLNMDLRKLTSALTATDRLGSYIPTADSMRNDLWYNCYQVGIDQDYTYKKGNALRMRLMIPTYLSIITNDDRLAGNSVSYCRWIVNPTLTADYSFTPSFKAVANGYYRKSYGNMSDAYKGYILQSYRNLLRNTTDHLQESNGSGARMGLEYRDVIRMLFFNVSGGIQHSRKNLLYGYNYEGIVGVKTTLDQSTNADTYSLIAGVSKTLGLWHTKLEASVGWNLGKSELLLQNVIQSFHTKSYTVGVSFNATPCQYFNLAYSFAWMKTEQWVANGDESLPALRTHSHNGKVWIFPTERLSINFNVDYQYFNESSTPNIVFADALIRYACKTVDWELGCSNLFNARRYVVTIHSNMSTSINSCQLRPLNLLLKVRFKLK
ncbi:MAG: carboxypeptidase regulatory-like domain-containing protein [Bacteroidaceae bacterium]|nr:carboxypeptidase regulatory-like domain-containing protein [Bacteroidaceae bacterium]